MTGLQGSPTVAVDANFCLSAELVGSWSPSRPPLVHHSKFGRSTSGSGQQRRFVPATFAARMAIIDPRYLNNAIASSASTPPVIEIGANGALAATSALDSMI